MILRRLLLPGSLIAIPVLPAWVIAARSLVPTWGDVPSMDRNLVAALLLAPLLAAALAVPAVLIRLRRGVREARAVGRWDAALLLAWYAVVVAFAVVPAPWDAVLLLVGVGLGTAVVWLTATELVAETRARVRAAMAALEQTGLGGRRRGTPSGADRARMPGADASGAHARADRPGRADPSVLRMRTGEQGWHAD